MATTEKAQYDNVATEYNKTYDDLPIAKLEAQLIRAALGDCTGVLSLVEMAEKVPPAPG